VIVLALQAQSKVLKAHYSVNLVIINLDHLESVLIVTQVLLFEYFISDILSQVFDGLMAFDHEFMYRTFLVYIRGHPHKLLCYQLYFRNW
jgi:hypothetical protein